jgi:hypothetical protein
MMRRYAFVIEFLCDERVGKGDDGEEKVANYLLGLSRVLEKDATFEPSSHLSKKYGLAGWLPLSDGGAIHLYAWDDRKPSFVSVDIVAPVPINKNEAMNYTQKYFEVSNSSEMVSKSISPPPPTWKELARDVYRQRLMLCADGCRSPRFDQIADFLPQLAKELDMVPLRSVFANRYNAWMHWETSGCVLSWRKQMLSVDIYTCKRFSSKHAENFTRDFFSLKALVSYCY